MDITIRPEQPTDYYDAEWVTREAFWNRYMPGCCEHYLLHRMRQSADLVRELDLVAAHGERIVGHVACMKGHIEGDDGERRIVLTLGPISVLPAFQRQGIGGQLLEAVKEKARTMGFNALLLCGDPDYYSRYGFISAERFGIRTADDMYADALQAFELQTDALKGAQGRYHESPAYQIDERQVEAHDSLFPPKPKMSGTPSQLRFNEISSRMRKA